MIEWERGEKTDQRCRHQWEHVLPCRTEGNWCIYSGCNEEPLESSEKRSVSWDLCYPQLQTAEYQKSYESPSY